MQDLLTQIAGCRLCADRFAQTETAHHPRPVLRVSQTARILVAGQAPGARVHQSGLPFTDPSGDRLRDWMGVDSDLFYDQTKIAILPMAFCFPGYRKGADLPPPRICAKTWRRQVLDRMTQIRLTLLIGGYAQSWHLGRPARVSDRVADWRRYLPDAVPLPHPSWRNSAWLKRNPWFEANLLPVLKARIQEVLT